MASGRANRKVRQAFGMQLRALRKGRQLSQERLGEAAGLSGKFIGEVERAEKSISLDSLAAVAEALDVSVVELVRLPGGRPDLDLERLLAFALRHRKRAGRLLEICAAALGEEMPRGNRRPKAAEA